MTYEQSPLGRFIPSAEDSVSSENNATLRDALLNLAVPVCVTDEGVNTRGAVNFDSRSTQGVPLTGLALPCPSSVVEISLFVPRMASVTPW